MFPGAVEPSTARPDMVLKRQLWDTLLPVERPGSALRKEALGFWLNGTIAPRLQHFGHAPPNATSLLQWPKPYCITLYVCSPAIVGAPAW